jgi:ATP-dependent exoDNAse (exonuclease V) beta subunit (contains helicase and exonuclease domains)
MLRQTLHRLDLPARWLSEEDGERRLTNVLHLAELLQTASGTLDGEQALIRWLQEQMTGQSTEEQVVRLESEADLVRVVTIHKSKGLEYPLVFLPFATAFKEAKDGADDRERLREDLRLLYVALTRARHALWVGIAALKVGKGSVCMLHRSAIGYLLGGERRARAPPFPACCARLLATARRCSRRCGAGGRASALAGCSPRPGLDRAAQLSRPVRAQLEHRQLLRAGARPHPTLDPATRLASGGARRTVDSRAERGTARPCRRPAVCRAPSLSARRAGGQVRA